MNKKALFEAGKEVGRLILFTAVSYLLTEGVLDTLVTMFRPHLDPTVKTMIVGFLVYFLRAVDKYRFENTNRESGLAPF